MTSIFDAATTLGTHLWNSAVPLPLARRAYKLIHDQAIAPLPTSHQVETGVVPPTQEELRHILAPTDQPGPIARQIRQWRHAAPPGLYTSLGSLAATAVTYALTLDPITSAAVTPLAGYLTQFGDLPTQKFLDRKAIEWHAPHYFWSPNLVHLKETKHQEALHQRHLAFHAVRHFELVGDLREALFRRFATSTDLQELRALADSFALIDKHSDDLAGNDAKCILRLAAYARKAQHSRGNRLKVAITLKALILTNTDYAWRELEFFTRRTELDGQDISLDAQYLHDMDQGIDMREASFGGYTLNAKQAAWILNFNGRLKGATLTIDSHHELEEHLDPIGRANATGQKAQIRTGITRFKKGRDFTHLEDRHDISQIVSQLFHNNPSIRKKGLQSLNTKFAVYIDQIGVRGALMRYVQKYGAQKPAKPDPKKPNETPVIEFIDPENHPEKQNLEIVIRLLTFSASPEAKVFLASLLLKYELESMDVSHIPEKPEPHSIQISDDAYEIIFRQIEQETDEDLIPILLRVVGTSDYVSEKVLKRAIAALTYFSPQQLTPHRTSINAIAQKKRAQISFINQFSAILEKLPS